MTESGKSKKILLPSVVLATSFYYSLSFTLGIVIGYLISRVFCRLFVHKGKINSIFLDYGRWKIHLHHWIMGLVFLAVVWVIDFFYLPTFFVGVVCGIIIQDIYDYNDWYKIVEKNPNYISN